MRDGGEQEIRESGYQRNRKSGDMENRRIEAKIAPFGCQVPCALSRFTFFSAYMEFVRYCPKKSGAYTESFDISPELPALA